MKFISAIVVALAMAGAASAQVTVQGVGSVSVTPDNAVINVTVATNGDNMKTAVKFNSDEMQGVMKLLRETFKLGDDDLCTHSFRVDPQYERKKDGGYTDRVTGYVAYNFLAVTLKDANKAGEVLGSLGAVNKNDAIRVTGVNFVVSDTLRNSVLDKCRELAVNDAKSRAELYVKTAGAKLGAVTSISENEVYVPRYESGRMYAAAPRAMADSVPVSAGQQKVRVGVTLTYSIK